jgi:hypothetical protein
MSDTTSSAEPRPKQEHTPGPWHWVNPITDEPRQPGEYFASLRTVAEHKSAWGDYTLPDFILEVEEIREESMEANARLIAAAPDLLAAAKRAEYELRDAVHIFKLDGMTSFAKAAEQAADFASKAIAKAEGRV